MTTPHDAEREALIARLRALCNSFAGNYDIRLLAGEAADALEQARAASQPACEAESDENMELRAILAKVTTALGTGAFCSSMCSLEFLRMIPAEVEKTVARLKAASQPARNEWKEWIIEKLVVSHIYRNEHETDPLKAINDLLSYEVEIALDPQVSSDAQALIDRGKAEAIQPAQEHITHDVAQRKIAACVREIEILCDSFGYDPAQWLADHELPATEPAQEPVPALARIRRVLKQHGLTAVGDAVVEADLLEAAAPPADDEAVRLLLGAMHLIDSLRTKGETTYDYVQSRSGSMVYVSAARREIDAYLAKART